MPPRLNEPIPLEALRDLIGICRALYAAWTAAAAGPIELEELLQVGKDLREAHRMASNTPPNTIGHRAAWSRADEAIKRLGDLITDLEQLGPVVAAATLRVLGGGGGKPGQSCSGSAVEAGGSAAMAEREAKKKHARMRS